MKFALIMPGAGSGARLGAALPKALIDLHDSPLFVRSAIPFLKHADCVEAIFAAPAGYENQFGSMLEQVKTAARLQVVTGGATRQDSVFGALQKVGDEAEIVLIHDAARPFVTLSLIQRVLDAVTGACAAALPGLPITDTVKRISGIPPFVSNTVDRRDLVTVQTPQALRIEIARQAFALAADHSFNATDDVALIEHFGLGSVRLVEGDPANIKITTSDDLDRARDQFLERFEARETAR